MSIHSGYSSLGSRSKKVEVTTTLYELMEAISESIDTTAGSRLSGSFQEKSIPIQDRLIAKKISSMFIHGRIKFKRPRDVRESFPELFD